MSFDLGKPLATSLAWWGEMAKDSMWDVIGHAWMGEAERCESEIEKLFFLAWIVRLEAHRILGSNHGGEARYEIVRPGETLDVPHFDHPVWQYDLIAPQVAIEGYRADFVLCRAVLEFPSPLPVSSPKVVIECDGHDFHEKTKEQAARDKERDRLLQTHGYYVLRFTGSELWRDALKCVEQVEDFLEDHISRSVVARRQATKEGSSGR